jgi:methylated-DNA-[protein]-cysteine S-methyltransferase
MRAMMDTDTSLERTWTVYRSPVGGLTLVAGPNGITNIHFGASAATLPAAARRPMPELATQLTEYFQGTRRAFDLDLDVHGTPLQEQVWERLLRIPHGTTTTYGEIAREVEESLFDPGLEVYRRPQVVGAAIGSNPVAILIPCHRVVGADGSLTGYRGGLTRKRALLELEGADGAWRARGRPEGGEGGQLRML